MTSGSRAAGLVLGFAADRWLGDPARWHPVAGFGRAAGSLERLVWAERRTRGTAYAGVLVGGCAGAGLLVERVSRRLPPPTRVLITAAVTWAVLGGRSLDREAAAVADLLDADDLLAARQRLTHLVGRDTARLDEGEVARAVVESLAENTSDAVVASLVWGAVAGVPGLLAHRAANTLDAMVGHHSTRYERFGWASARLDDLLGLPGSRLTAALTVATGPDRAAAWRAWRRDAPGHPSPNAGPVEAAVAGALGLRLGGVNTYADRVEDRHHLGDGRPPAARDIAAARRLATRVDLAALVVSAGMSVGVSVGIGALTAAARGRRSPGGPRRTPRRRAG